MWKALVNMLIYALSLDIDTVQSYLAWTSVAIFQCHRLSPTQALEEKPRTSNILISGS